MMLIVVNRPCIPNFGAYTTHMLLANKSVIVVIALLVLALAGLLAVQALLLNYALELKNQAFSQNVLTALSTVAQQVETAELAHGVAKVLMIHQPVGDHKTFFRALPPLATDHDTIEVDTVKFFSITQGDGPIAVNRSSPRLFITANGIP